MIVESATRMYTGQDGWPQHCWQVRCDGCGADGPFDKTAGDAADAARRAGFTTKAPARTSEACSWACPSCSNGSRAGS